jgi:2-polyprenyl-3-methyl-5-hydroxy-6-metoxy-1,4-benzoquinol methylase
MSYLNPNYSQDLKPQDYYLGQRPEILTEFLKINKQDKLVALDIGCGKGGFLKSLQDNINSVELWGVEPNIVKSDFEEINFINNSIEEALKELPDNYFDVIFMNDVIEHLADPEIILKEVKLKLKPNGYLVSSIPNVRFIKNLKHILINKDFKYEDSGIRDYTHLRFFTQKSINNMFNQLGLEIVLSKGINPFRSKLLGIPLSVINQKDIIYLQFLTICKLKVN